MISPADWQRMSWHARQKYLQRQRQRPVPTEAAPNPVEESKAPVKFLPFRNDGIVRRCVECGAWMIDVCNTDHGRRYEP